MTYSTTASRLAPQTVRHTHSSRSKSHPVFAMPAVARSGRLTPPPAPVRRQTASRSRLVAVLVIIAFVVVMVGSRVGADAGPVPTARHHVAAGETLWGLASALTPQGESVWDYVALLKDLNSLETSSLQIDQVLLVPIASE